MEPGSKVNNVFSIHELILLVSAHLSPPDVARCVLVCKDWRHHFEPSLWTNFSPHVGDFCEFISTRPQVKAALIRNLPHIRTLEDFSIDVEVIEALSQGLPQQRGESVQDPDTLCTNLRRINLDSFSSDDFYFFAQRLDRLLRHNQRLSHLVVHFEILDFEYSYATISTLRHLQHLTVSSLDDYASPEEILKLLQACLPLPDLTELHIDSDVLWDASDNDPATDTAQLELILQEARIARFAGNSAARKIKSLHFPGTLGEVWVPLPLLLLKSGLLDLETCNIPPFRPARAVGAIENVDEIELVVREHCPNLKHVKCPMLLLDDVPAVRAFIRGCSGLSNFTSYEFCDGPALKPRSLLSELVSSHHATLAVLELGHVRQIFSRDLQEVLTRCKQLKRFWVTSNFDEDTSAAIAATDIYGSDWVCMELKELSLVLNLCPSNIAMFSDMGLKEVVVEGVIDYDDQERLLVTTKRGEVVEWHEDESDSYNPLVILATRHIYRQIGRLEKLEELQLDVDRSPRTWQMESDYASNLTLSKGWLGELAGLKKLRMLKLKTDFWSEMGQAEMEFMDKHWPLLKDIAFECDIAQIEAMPHWQWLLHKRPQLRVVSTLYVPRPRDDSDVDFDL